MNGSALCVSPVQLDMHSGGVDGWVHRWVGEQGSEQMLVRMGKQ